MPGGDDGGPFRARLGTTGPGVRDRPGQVPRPGRAGGGPLARLGEHPGRAGPPGHLKPPARRRACALRTLDLRRQGESAGTRETRSTGWTDVALSAAGVEEARRAGRALRESGFTFDVAHTSLLKRAIRTLWIAL